MLAHALNQDHRQPQATTSLEPKKPESSDVTGEATGPPVLRPDPSLKPKLIRFNFGTPKFHFLGDYTSTIRRYGTTDSYSTQSVSKSGPYMV